MTAVETGYAPPNPGEQPGDGRRRLRWLTVATVAWAVLLAGLTWWSVRTDPPTVKEQRSLDQAGPVVDRAIGELTGAVGVRRRTGARAGPAGTRLPDHADGLRRDA